jgi:uncharacterized damage-inducible protein DinB
MAVTTDELDFETAPYEPKQLDNAEQAMAYFDECVSKGMNALKNTDDSVLDEKWTLRSGSTVYSVVTKEEVVRMAHNQTVHHRAQLGVNYRLLGIPVPQSYGPTADYTDF